MPSVPSISFNVRFDLTGAPSLLLTDTTTYPVGAIGIFTVTQPDGYVRTGNFATPDVTSSGGTFSTNLRLSSTGGVQCGTYIIKYEIRTTDDVISTFTRNFVFQYEPVNLIMKENFDVFTPNLSYSDSTNYSVSGYSNTAPTRSWTAVSIPTGTKTSTTAAINLQHNGNYYDAVYTITLASTLLYTHQTYAWLSVRETISKTVTAEACTPEPIEDLIPMIETLRQQSIECNGDFPDFEKAQTLFSHLTDMLRVLLLGGVTQEGIYDVYEDLLVILRNNQSIPCVHTNQPIPAYDLGDYAVSQFPIDAAFCTTVGDGVNTVYSVTHNLNDDCVIVQVYEVTSGAQVLTDVTITSNNSVNVSFASAPATDAYKVVVHSGNAGMVGPGLEAGGTTGQFLRKQTDTDYDTYWDTLSAGDIPDLSATYLSKAVYDTDNDGVVDDSEKITIVARNSTGSTIHKGKIVYLQGSTGNRPNMILAQANSEATSSKTFGVVVEDVANNADGNVAAIGTLHDLDTRSGAPNPFTTDTLLDGDLVWLSATNPGYITRTPPTQPNHTVFVGIVARTSPTNGRIVYKIQNGFELQELHNVLISSVADKDTLYYDLATGLWKNTSKGAWLGGTASQFVKGDGTLDSNTYLTTGSASSTYVALAGSYSNPSWITGLAWSKITGAPAFLTAETDPVFTSHPAAFVTSIKISNWDDAYTWVANFPTQTGNAGKFLTTDGNTLSWANVVSGVSSFNTRTGAVTLNSSDVTIALGYTPYNSTNPSGYITGINAADVITALGYTPVTNARTLTINGTSYDLSADRSWTVTATSNNIYNTDGTLTSNRTVSGGGFTLALNPIISFGEQITGISNKTYSTNFSGGTSLEPASLLINNNITHNGGTSYQPRMLSVRSYFTNDGSSGNNALIGWSTSNFSSIRGLTTGAFIGVRNVITQTRDDANDISTNGSNYLEGINISQGHFFTASSGIYSNNLIGFSYAGSVRTGTANNVYGHTSNLSVSTFTTGNNSVVNNYYAYTAGGTVGAASGPTGLISNYFGLYLFAPQVNATGTITNRWGVFAPDSAMSHSLLGDVIIGGSTLAGYKLDVQGTFRQTGSTTAASSLAAGSTITPTLVASANNDVLVGMDIQPTFTNGAFTGVSNFALRTNGSVRIQSTNGVSALSIVQATRAIYFTCESGGGLFNSISSGPNGSTGTGNFGFTISSGWGFAIGTDNALANGVFQVYPTGTTAGTIRMGTGTTSAFLSIGGSVTASSAIARGVNITSALTAAANNDVLVGLDINPTFTNGAFTSVANIGLRVSNSYLVVAGDYFPATPIPPKGLIFEASGGSARITSRFSSAAATLDINASTLGLSASTVNIPGGSFTSTVAQFNQFVRTQYTAVSGGMHASFGQNLMAANDHLLYASTGRKLFIDADNIIFTKQTAATAIGQIYGSTGNWLIQTGGTFTDAGFKLDVQGTGRFTGAVQINGYTISSPSTGSIKIGNNPTTTGTNVTAFGDGAITTNLYVNSVAIGQASLGIGTTGTGNRVVGVGYYAGYSNAGSFNTYLGAFCGWYQTTGQNNVFIGDLAGRDIGSGANLTIANNSIFIGQATRALADNQTNQIVIGYAETGLGSNTTIIGNSSTTLTAIRGSLISGGTSVNSSAQLQIDSNTKGFLPPRMTSAERAAISTPATGLVIYQTDGTEGLYERTSTGWRIINQAGGGSGTVTSVSVVSANGFAGTVANNTTTPAITLSTTITGLIKGNGTALSAAVAGTDYLTPSDVAYSVANVSTTYSETATKGTRIIKGDTTGGAFTITLPTAVGNTATIIIKKVAGSGALTVDGAGSETIDGGTTATIIKVNESITLVSDNTNWQIV